MYIGNGRNYIVNDNKLFTEYSIIVESDFRQVEDNLNIEDCRYKKCDEGYITYRPQSGSLNLLPTDDKYLEMGTSTNVVGKTWDQAKINPVTIDTRVREKDVISVKPNTTYKVTSTSNGFKIVVKEFNELGIGIKDIGWVDMPYTFTTLENTQSIACMFAKTDVIPITIGEVVNCGIMICEGEINLPYTPFKVDRLTFENTESNDIDDLRHQVSLTGFSYPEILQNSFNKLLKGEL